MGGSTQNGGSSSVACPGLGALDERKRERGRGGGREREKENMEYQKSSLCFLTTCAL